MIAVRLTLLGALISVLVLAGWWIHRSATMAERGRWEARIAQENEARRVREIELVKSVERVAEDAHAETLDQADRAAAAGAELDGLRAAIVGARSRDAASLAAARLDAARAGQLLEACAGEHFSLARDADRVRGQLIGLQDYVRSVCTAD